VAELMLDRKDKHFDALETRSAMNARPTSWSD
jgi:hypothetical protein